MKRWPFAKKMVYKEHMDYEGKRQEHHREKAEQEAHQKVPNAGGGKMPNVPASARKHMKGANAPSVGGGSTEATQHPALGRYSNLIDASNAKGPDTSQYGEQSTDDLPDPGVEVTDTKGIGQASEDA